jgi:alpha-ketoglutarate-dependent taurine dioxygenase
VTEHRPALAGRRRQAVHGYSRDWVHAECSNGHLPLLVRPTMDVDLAAWSAANAAIVDGWLAEQGAVLFTGFGVGLPDFARVARSLAGQAQPYRERSSPRTELGAGVYTSTDYPAHQAIPLHNENSYQRCFPARLALCCLTAAEYGGATPLADSRRVLARLDPAIVTRFRERGVRYVRNYHESFGLSWQEAFQETDPARVDAYCKAEGITTSWRAAGGLRTEQVRPALARHPGTGQEVWFNHVTAFHVSSLPPEVAAGLLAQFGAEGLPLNSYYGDGAPIESAILDEINAAYQAELVALPWRVGDVLLIDNLLAAHGREPYHGARRVAVSLAGQICHQTTTTS